MTENTMRTVLSGKTLSSLLPTYDERINSNPLWIDEYNIGININPKTKVTDDNSLFGRSFILMNNDIQLIVAVNGFEKDVDMGTIVRLGGEDKCAELEVSKESIELPKNEIKVDDDKIRFCVILITPGKLPDGKKELINYLENYFSAEFVTAGIGKRVLIGGWNSVKHEPIPLKSYIPSGSTLFFECYSENKSKIESFN